MASRKPPQGHESADAATAKLAPVSRRGADAPLSITVVSGASVTTHVLPASGAVTIGRALGCDVRVEDASISRQHAVLDVGPPPTITDAGSANGTRVAGERVRPGVAVPLAPGAVFEVGTVPVFLRRGGTQAARVVGASAQQQQGSAAEGPMAALHRLVGRVAASPLTVLILGETGVGKEVLAETLHRSSPRSEGRFLRLNCAALSESLLESELFGHEKGAFTGAAQSKRGLLESAAGGTVFLDEVGELPPSVQVKLLRVLEEKKALRVGGLVPVDVDARFVAATNRDLEAEVDAGRFRQDLYFRLNGIALYIPPLRERVEEIPALARTFIARVSEAMNRPPPVLGDDALRALEAHAWPGNVRELKNAVEHAVVLAGDDVIRPEHLPWNAPHARRPRATRSAAPSPPPAAEPALRGDIDALEHRRILDTLAECGGNQTRAAKALGISRGTLAARLERFGLPRPKKG